MKYLLFFTLLAHSLSAQTAELNADEYYSWKVNYTPYKIKAIQAINDFRSLANDTTFPRARFQDDLIVIQSRISGDIEQVWFGNRSKRLFVLTRQKVQAVFSRSFIETILDRNQYYYLNFDAFGDNNSLQKTLDYLYSTWWGSFPKNEFTAANFRLLLYIPSSDLHIETSMGDEYIGLPSWIGGFTRAGLVHTSFRFGIQMGSGFKPLYGTQKTLNGGWGGYGALNLENLRIGIASSYKPPKSFDNTVIDKNDIRYAGLMAYFSYSPILWNESWGAGRVWLGISYINLYNVREDQSGSIVPQLIPVNERGSSADSLRGINLPVYSPIVRAEFVSPVVEGNYSTMESYIQIANISATGSFTVNFGQAFGAGLIAHYNASDRNKYPKGIYLFPTLRLRF